MVGASKFALYLLLTRQAGELRLTAQITRVARCPHTCAAELKNQGQAITHRHPNEWCATNPQVDAKEEPNPSKSKSRYSGDRGRRFSSYYPNTFAPEPLVQFATSDCSSGEALRSPTQLPPAAPSAGYSLIALIRESCRETKKLTTADRVFKIKG